MNSPRGPAIVPFVSQTTDDIFAERSSRHPGLTAKIAKNINKIFCGCSCAHSHRIPRTVPPSPEVTLKKNQPYQSYEANILLPSSKNTSGYPLIP